MLHIVTSKFLEVGKLSAEIAAGERPGYVLLDLAARTESCFEMPDDSLAVTTADKVWGKLFSSAALWALGRRVAERAGAGDTVFCTGEDVGIPVAAACAGRRDAPKVFVTVHNLFRPRGRVAMRLFRPKGKVTGWLTPSPTQATFLTTQFGIPAERVHVIPEQTDTRFYRPGAGERSGRPVIVSVGLEQRDYRTLAEATHDLPVDVRISGFSQDAKAMRAAFPEQLPTNMTRKFYEWRELAALYQSAAIVVVPLFANDYVAGITTFLEGMACRRPVIATRTEGLSPYTDVKGICLTVPPGNAMALRTAIQHLLSSPPTGKAVAARGHAWLLGNHTPGHWVDGMMRAMGLESSVRASAQG